MKANKVVVLNWEIAEENEAVRELMQAMEITDILDLFEGDPDMINISGEKVLFTSIANDSVVIYIDPSYTADNAEIETILFDFFSSENVEPIENNWDNFHGTNRSIAYRGGSGYCYSIYRHIA